MKVTLDLDRLLSEGHMHFERLGASPASILIAGLLTLAIAIAPVRYNRAATPEPS